MSEAGVVRAGDQRGESPPVDQPGTGQVGRRRWAVCCSGGGIRSAAYCLGGLQELDRTILPGAKVVTAVSGGSYIAAARALVERQLRAESAPRRAYAPGSPEERALRDNTRYLVPGAAEGLVGIAALVMGAGLALALVLGWLFSLGALYGWLLSTLKVLVGLDGAHPRAEVVGWGRWWWWIWPAAAGAVALVAVGLSGWPGAARRRGIAGMSRVALRAGGAAVVLSIALLGAPAAVQGLYHVGLTNTSAAGTVVRAVGFASSSARQGSHPSTAVGSGVSNPAPHGDAPTRPADWWAGVAAFGASVIALVKAAMGRLSSVSSDLEKQKWITPYLTPVTRALRRYVVPWAGSALVIAGLGVLALLWTADGTVVPVTRRWWVLVALAVPLLGRIRLDVNRTSLHDFYRWRLASLYGAGRAGPEMPGGQAFPADGGPTDTVRLSDLNDRGVPTLALCASANSNAKGEVPAGRGAFSFVFDPVNVTLHDVPSPAADRRAAAPADPARDVRAATPDYEHLVGQDRMTLFDVVAMCGAAVAPLMGKMTRHPLRLLLTVANVRLGVWLPHPRVVEAARDWIDHAPAAARSEPPRWPWLTYLRYARPHLTKLGREQAEQHEKVLWGHLLWYREDAAKDRPSVRWARMKANALWRLMQPTLGLLAKEAIGRASYRSTWMYITDGGHYDNLGLVVALHDEAVTDVVVLDASGDDTDTWTTLGQAIALARADVGVEIDLDPTVMTSGPDTDGSSMDPASADRQVARPWAAGTFVRPDGRRGNIWLAKAGVWPGAPWDVRSYRRSHPDFPCTTTGKQLYNENQFEAYHALGAATVRAIPDLPARPDTPVAAAVTRPTQVTIFQFADRDSNADNGREKLIRAILGLRER